MNTDILGGVCSRAQTSVVVLMIFIWGRLVVINRCTRNILLRQLLGLPFICFEVTVSKK